MSGSVSIGESSAIASPVVGNGLGWAGLDRTVAERRVATKVQRWQGSEGFIHQSSKEGFKVLRISRDPPTTLEAADGGSSSAREQSQTP